MPLWRAPHPLVLASKSAARRAVLEAAGVPIEIDPADIDERAVEQGATGDAEAVATLLAREKARAVSARRPGRFVIGADQTLEMDGRRFTKPRGRADAAQQLRDLRGRTHALHSAFAVARDGAALVAGADIARMTMRDFSDRFLESYLDEAGDAVTASVGGYQVEGRGVQLFEKIEGSHFTILGLPLLALLAWLRREQLLTE
ncbi:MAG: nucleoside triphosphate pyrophosphatase [Pseudorhodoplanes sp.]